MKRSVFPVIAILLALAVPSRAAAIPPPDFLIAIGSSFGQIFSLVVVLLSGLFAAVAQTLEAYRPQFRVRPAVCVTAIVALVSVSAAIATVVDQTRQRTEVTRIVEKSVIEGTLKSDALPVAGSSYFHDNETLPLDISNEDFAAIESAGPFVLDAREDEEVEIGRYPGSAHVRLADLLDGAFANVPRDRTVYVLCWSGIRGNQVASFLRDHGIVARYLTDGAEGWVAFGGTWEGGIKLSSVYSAPQYARTLTADETAAAVENGAVLVDSRDAERIAGKPLATAVGVVSPDGENGSIAISAIFTPTARLDAALALVPAGAKAITVCDDFVSCFDAKLVGIRLEKRGHAFLGRYVY